jgi:hypothetical protein
MDKNLKEVLVWGLIKDGMDYGSIKKMTKMSAGEISGLGKLLYETFPKMFFGTAALGGTLLAMSNAPRDIKKTLRKDRMDELDTLIKRIKEEN